MRHFAHYIKREIADPVETCDSSGLPYVEWQPQDQGFDAPAYHSVPLNSGVAKRVDVGHKIWLFSQLSSRWGKLPPSLDGVITVAEIDYGKRLEGRYWYRAENTSKWFPLFDASCLLGELNAVDAQCNIRPLLRTPRTAIGQAVHFLREISDGTLLLKHAEKLEGMPLDFISYRIIDGTKTAFELARQLVNSERAVFWDRWSLPRRLAERKETTEPPALDSRISSMIRSARVVWGVGSKLYGTDGSYSKLEQNLAEKKGVFKPYPVDGVNCKGH